MDLDFWDCFGRNFFSKIQVLPILSSPKDLDPSYKMMDLVFLDCSGRKKNLNLINEEIRYLFCDSLQTEQTLHSTEFLLLDQTGPCSHLI